MIKVKIKVRLSQYSLQFIRYFDDDERRLRDKRKIKTIAQILCVRFFFYLFSKILFLYSLCLQIFLFFCFVFIVVDLNIIHQLFGFDVCYCFSCSCNFISSQIRLPFLIKVRRFVCMCVCPGRFHVCVCVCSLGLGKCLVRSRLRRLHVRCHFSLFLM